ncbi:DUF6339 family protein [Clostridium estertheticum]|uniref:DUF6339 family protein n=1 Tax=Clostridium estertheticum TaxID=238834 RepID=UPI001C6F4073|nr:DUF6339 family protein [Clostridium estertheticum]MBW9151462.1 hypothetical protein [Clostridium estertheticum]WLC83401.1 hypothetical protein KTC97_15060 [Clostridium estertheticum]
MILKYFKEDNLEILRSSVKNNIEMYKQNNVWLDNFFSSEEYSFPSNVNVRDIKLHIPKTRREHMDLENTKLVYEAMMDLTIPQAIDERLWAYLTHVIFWDYMRVRWDIEKLKDTSDLVNIIKERYFVPGDSTKSLVRNGISRLWWYGKVTYDTSYSNPFALTEILLSTQDIAQNLMERAYSRNETVLKAILRVLYDMKLKGKPLPNVDSFRKITKDINRVGGIAILDNLDANDIEHIVTNSLAG